LKKLGSDFIQTEILSIANFLYDEIRNEWRSKI